MKQQLSGKSAHSGILKTKLYIHTTNSVSQSDKPKKIDNRLSRYSSSYDLRISTSLWQRQQSNLLPRKTILLTFIVHSVNVLLWVVGWYPKLSNSWSNSLSFLSFLVYQSDTLLVPSVFQNRSDRMLRVVWAMVSTPHVLCGFRDLQGMVF